MGGNLMFGTNNSQKPDKMTKAEMDGVFNFLQTQMHMWVCKKFKAGSCREADEYPDDHLFGDIDLLVYESFYNNLENDLYKVSDKVMKKKIGKTRSSVVFEVNGKYHQVDFIRIPFSDEEFYSWAHSSSYKDTKLGIKGVALKMVMRALTGIELIKLPDGTITNLYAFSVDYGLRRKYRLDDTGNHFIKNEMGFSTLYETDIQNIFKTFNIFIDKNKYWSFIDVAYHLYTNYPNKHEQIKYCLIRLLGSCQDFDSDELESLKIKKRIMQVFSRPDLFIGEVND